MAVNNEVVTFCNDPNQTGDPNETAYLIETYTYDSFGTATIRDAEGIELDGSAVSNPYMFTARRYDGESGLYYYRFRMYDAQLGRFLQTDPIGYYDSMNMYQYCLNNPTNWVDPWGLDVWISRHGIGGWHYNINIGKRGGSYRSYGYRLVDTGGNSVFNNWFNPFSKNFRRGEVYRNAYRDGYPSRFLRTTPNQDKCIIDQMDNLVGAQGPYDIYRTCRQFSNLIFDSIAEHYGLFEEMDRFLYNPINDPDELPIDTWY